MGSVWRLQPHLAASIALWVLKAAQEKDLHKSPHLLILQPSLLLLAFSLGSTSCSLFPP